MVVENLYAVILAGGKGERFWPLSRKDHPKQLLPIGGKKSMIEESVRRISPLIPPERTIIVINENLKAKIEKLLPKIPKENILGEPIGRNTAPAIGLAAIVIQSKDRNGTMVILPADHIIKNNKRFLEIVKAGAEVAQRNKCLLTIGIQPTHPEPGYGHIKLTEKVLKKNKVEIFKVDMFVEKPDIDRAREYTAKGYLWNSGIFIWKTSTILNAISKYMPALYNCLMEIRNSLEKEKEAKTIKEVYGCLEEKSIDYGVMEKSQDVYVVKGDFLWNDVGSWSAMEKIYTKDDNNNVKIGEIVDIDTKDSILLSKKRLIATIGVKDLIIVETEDVVLVCPKKEAQRIKELVSEIKKDKNLSLLL